MKMFYVYLLKTSDGEIFYVGKGNGNRCYRHTQIALGKSKNREKNPKLYNKISSILKSGGFINVEIIYENESEKLCFDREVEIIKSIGLQNLCNITEGGEGTSGYSLSEETRKKMSKAKKGRVFSDEHRLKLSESAKGRRGAWAGKKLSEAHKLKMSLSHKNKIFSAEHRKNLSIALKGKQKHARKRKAL